MVNPQSSSVEKVDQVDANDVRTNARRSLTASALHASVIGSTPQCKQLVST